MCTLWNKVMKKVKSAPQNAFLYKKCRILKTSPCIENTGTVLRTTYIQTISQNKNENQTPRLGFKSKNVRKFFFPKTLKQCHMVKICSRKIDIFQLLSTMSWKAIVNIFIPDENITIQSECCFRWAEPLNTFGQNDTDILINTWRVGTAG